MYKCQNNCGYLTQKIHQLPNSSLKPCTPKQIEYNYKKTFSKAKYRPKLNSFPYKIFPWIALDENKIFPISLALYAKFFSPRLKTISKHGNGKKSLVNKE